MSIEARPDSRMGRPRGFDEDKALEAAMRVFWAKSYDGATMSDLTEAMGINRSSMYAAFGDKERLFRRAIKHYRSSQMSFVRVAMALPTLREAVVALFRGSAEFFGTPGKPKGCLSVTGAIACGDDSVGAREAVYEWQKQSKAAIKRRVQQAQREGDLNDLTNAADLAEYISTFLSGLAVQSANGATKTEMARCAEFALQHIGL